VIPGTPRGARLLGAGLLLAVFAAGTLAGAAADRVLHAGETTPASPPGWECRPERGHHTLFDALDLTPEQRARVDSIMAASRTRVRTFWEEEGSHIRAMVDSTRAEVRNVLTPEQQAEYDRLRGEWRARQGHKGRRPQGRVPGAPDPAAG
jgi:Spy/CpxP family protein refolding chaperone